MKRWMFGLIGVSLLAGCAHDKPPTDLVSTGTVHVQSVPSNQADLPTPSIKLTGDVMQIAGVVRRKADYNGPLDGHVKIEILGPDQKVAGQFPIEWQPGEVPVTGNREAQYSLNYGWVPPDGTTVRLSVVEDVDAELQQAGGDSAGARAGGNPQGVPTAIHTPHPTGTPRSGMAPGTPGMSHQATNSPSTPGAGRRGHR